MNIKDQIAAARALRDEWIHPDNPSYGGCIELIDGEMGWMLESLERACELLRDALWNLREADRAHLAEPISAFLAGEVKP